MASVHHQLLWAHMCFSMWDVRMSGEHAFLRLLYGFKSGSVTGRIMRHLVTTLTGKPLSLNTSRAELLYLCNLSHFFFFSAWILYSLSGENHSAVNAWGFSRALCSFSLRQRAIQGLSQQIILGSVQIWHSWFIIPLEAMIVNMPRLVPADDWHLKHSEAQTPIKETNVWDSSSSGCLFTFRSHASTVINHAERGNLVMRSLLRVQLILLSQSQVEGFKRRRWILEVGVYDPVPRGRNSRKTIRAIIWKLFRVQREKVRAVLQMFIYYQSCGSSLLLGFVLFSTLKGICKQFSVTSN